MKESWEDSIPTPSRGLTILMTAIGSLFLYILTQTPGSNDKIITLVFLIGLSVSLTIFEAFTLERIRK